MANQDRQWFQRRNGQLKLEKSYYIDHWTELAEYTGPRSARFFVTDRQKQGSVRNSKLIDGTPIFANRVLASGLVSGVTNPARSWVLYRMADPELNRYQPVKEWLDIARKRTHETFIKSNLYSVLPQAYGDLGAFGTTAFAVLEDPDTGITCEHFPIGSYSISTGKHGKVNTIYREFQMTVGQLVERFGEENCSSPVRDAFARGELDRWHTVIHAIEPNAEHDPDKLLSKFKKFISVYYEEGSKDVEFLSRKGFDDFPVMAPRWQTVGEDLYGISPGMDALGDIKSLQTMHRRKLQALDKKVTPPMVGPSSLKNKRVSLLSGDITYVDVANGTNSLTPAYQVNFALTELKEEIAETQYRIKQAFYSDLFLMISSIDRSNLTATEIAAKKEEQLLALGPVYLKLNDELLDPLVERTFRILLQQGKLPPPPPEMQGKEMAIEYVSTMAQTMKAVGVSNLERHLTFVGGLAQAWPTVLDGINVDAVVEEHAEMVGVPPRINNDEATRKAIRDQRAQADKAQQAMAMAQQGADVAQKLASSPLGDNNALSNIIQRMQGAPAVAPGVPA